jgi:hypothetical protein
MKESVEEGERELTGRCKLGRKQRDRVVAEAGGGGGNRSGHGQR